MHNPAMPLTRHGSSGFTLIELAIVLVIVSLLAGGMMMTLSAQMEQVQRSDTQRQLQDAREALLGYAASHSAADGKPYLPCPDTDGDGLENRDGSGACPAPKNEGNLPWASLGLASQDAWGNRFRYRVEPIFARTDNGFTLSTSANLRVCEDATCSSKLATSLPAVILSHGRNGLGAMNPSNVANPTPASADEKENADADNDFVFHTPAPAGANEFDDLVVWLSPSILYNRMITAGRLP